MKKQMLRLMTLALLVVLTLCLLPNSASAAQQKLGTTTDLTWNQYVDFNKWPQELEQSYGSVAWKPTEPFSPSEPILFEIKVYRNNTLWNTVTWGFDPQLVAEDKYLSCDLYAQKEFVTGTYYFTVQAIDNSGTYASSDVAKSGTWKYTKPSKKLAAPTNLRWDEEDTIHDWPWAKWDAVPGHDGTYEVYMYYSSTKEGDRHWFHQQWNVDTLRNAPPLFAIDDGLFGPGYYFFKVRACSDDITKVSNSPWAECEPYHWKMSTPKVKISNVSTSGKLKLTWNKVEFAEKYQIYRATSKTGSYSLLKTVTGTSYTDTTAAAGKVYYYKVRAVAADRYFGYEDGTVVEPGHKSSFSSPVSLRCDLPSPTVSAENVASSGKIKLSWKKISGAEQYLVYRRSEKESTYTRLDSTTSTSFTDKNAKIGTKYYYKVRAVHVNSAADSAQSAAVSETCALARPVVNIKLKNGDPRLTWEKISGAEKYYIYRATSKTGDYKLVKTTKTATSFTDTTAKSGKTYYYKVKAVDNNTAANSAYSAIDYIKAK